MNLASGKLWAYFLNAILITIPVSLVLLAWYRHSIARSMRLSRTASGSTSFSSGLGPTVAPHPPRPPTEVEIIERSERESRRRLLVVYGIGSIVAGGIMAFFFVMSMDFDLSSRAVFAYWWISAWPLIPTFIVLLALQPARNLLLLLVYALLGVALVGLFSGAAALFGDANASPWRSMQGMATLFIQVAWLPYVLIVVTGNRRLRSVSPMILAGLLMFSFGTLAARDVYVAAVNETPLKPWLLSAGPFTYSLWYLIAALPIGYFGWIGLDRLAGAYERKSFSDIQLLIDAWWLLVTFQFCTQLASDFGWYGLVGLLAFAGYRSSVEIGLRWWPLDTVSQRGPGLLLLRVFGFQRRTEGLFDAVAQQWRLMGHVMMIAGADLAMRTLDPGDIVSFIGGRFRKVFIGDEPDLKQRLSTLDTAPDPDGRFRVSKFFCYENT